jgi:hypothetical protein
MSPTAWKGQQTVIRRLSRTKGLSEKTMHDALRMGIKLHRAASPMHNTGVFRPNKDTPPDVRAEYLQAPHAFGLDSREDILAWSRQASNATILKMTTHSGIAALVLFERERPEAATHLRLMYENGKQDEFAWLQHKLATMPWSRKQLDTMLDVTKSNASRNWMKTPQLLDAFCGEMESHQRVVNHNWLSECLAQYSVEKLMQPFENTTMQKTSLVEYWRRLIQATDHFQEQAFQQTQAAAISWHARSPSQQDCLELARMLDSASLSLQTQCYSEPATAWQERWPVVLPWVFMLGRTSEEGQRAVETYQQFDPALLNFTIIAVSLSVPAMVDTIDNAPELLCP